MEVYHAYGDYLSPLVVILHLLFGIYLAVLKVYFSPVSDKAFGSVNCLSFAGGQPIVLNFLEAILPEIRKDLEAETQQANERIAKYADAAAKYD